LTSVEVIVSVVCVIVTLPFILGQVLLYSWKRQLRKKVSSYIPPKEHYWKGIGKPILCVVNPYGGNKQGQFMFEEVVAPTFDKSGIHYHVEYTRSASHPHELATSTDFKPYGAVMMISGDGMIHHWLNGIANRTDGPKRTEIERIREILHQTPLALIPGGSSCGVCASFGIDEVFAAVKTFVEGAPRPLDIMEITTFLEQDGKISEVRERRFDLHAVSYGMTTDFDIMTEGWMRFLGPTIKNFLAPIMVVLSGKRWPASVDFLPAKGVPQSDFDCGILTDPKKISVDNKTPSRLPRRRLATCR